VFGDVVKECNGWVTALDHASFAIARGGTDAPLGPVRAGSGQAVPGLWRRLSGRPVPFR
jgi:hypothetical protein